MGRRPAATLWPLPGSSRAEQREASQNAEVTDAMLRGAADDSAGSWIKEAIGPFGSGVRGLVPPVFDAYARIAHPAWASDGAAVRWTTVAAWSGGSAHALAEFELMAREPVHPSVPKPFAAPPQAGVLPLATLEALADVLANYTTTPDRCHFGVWDGYGWIGAMPPDLRAAAKLNLPNRSYLVFDGSLSAILELGWRWDLSNGSDRMRVLDSSSIGFRERAKTFLGPNRAEKSRDGRLPESDATLHRESPNLIWTTDRSWFVASEIDLDSTYVGGSTELINELLEDSRLEAWRTLPSDSVAADRDMLNRNA
jgi:hypothetical protein